MISIPYKGEIIVLDNDNKLHFINDGKEKFAVFVIDLYSLGTKGAFWVVSTIYPWTRIDTSTNEASQTSIDTISSQDKPSIKPKKHENPFASLSPMSFDEDDSEDCPVSEQTPQATLKEEDTLEEEEGSELPTLETIESTQANDVESELTSLPKKKAAKAKKQNLPNKPSINEKQLRKANKSDIEESALNGALGSKGTAQNQILELNENDAPISIEAGAIKIFASVLSQEQLAYMQEQLAYILLRTIKNGGDLNKVKCLIEECHCDVNIQDNNGHTALYYASALGHLEIVECLVEKGHCNVNIQDNDGHTALHYASALGHLEIVKCLVEKGHCNVNIQDNDGHTALHYASREGHLPVVKYLVACKCNVNIKDNNGMTALHHAAHDNHLTIVEYLVVTNKGYPCDVNIKDNNGQTALHYASLLGHLEIVKCLVEKGLCNINIPDKNGTTALFYALFSSLTQSDSDSDIVQYLFENGAKITDKKIRDYLREQQQKLNQKQKK